MAEDAIERQRKRAVRPDWRSALSITLDYLREADEALGEAIVAMDPD